MVGAGRSDGAENAPRYGSSAARLSKLIQRVHPDEATVFAHGDDEGKRQLTDALDARTLLCTLGEIHVPIPFITFTASMAGEASWGVFGCCIS
jgi:hypothetical protein